MLHDLGGPRLPSVAGRDPVYDLRFPPHVAIPVRAHPSLPHPATPARVHLSPRHPATPVGCLCSAARDLQVSPRLLGLLILQGSQSELLDLLLGQRAALVGRHPVARFPHLRKHVAAVGALAVRAERLRVQGWGAGEVVPAWATKPPTRKPCKKRCTNEIVPGWLQCRGRSESAKPSGRRSVLAFVASSLSPHQRPYAPPPSLLPWHTSLGVF